MRREFERLLKLVLRGAEFWKEETFFELSANYETNLYNLLTNKICIVSQFTLNPPINGAFIFYTISVDIVPSLCIKDYWPDEAVQDIGRDLKSDGCHLVLDEPHKLYPWISSNSIPYARISFARAGSRVIHNAPPLAKAALMIGKHLASFRENSNDRDTASHTRETRETASHTLKVSMLHCLASIARCNIRRASSWSRDYNYLSHQELNAMVGRLLFSLLHLCCQDFMPTFFQPQHFLPPFSQSYWLREPSMRLFSLGMQQLHRIGSHVESPRVINLMQAEIFKRSTQNEYKDRVSYFVMRSIFRTLFASEAESKVIDYGSFTNPLFEKIHRARLINSIYSWKQERSW